MQPNEPDDRDRVDPAEAEGPAHDMPPATRDAPLTTHGAVPSPFDPEPPVQSSRADDDQPDADGTLPPSTEADAVGYDDPSVSPVQALRDAKTDRS